MVLAQQAGAPELAASSLKAALDADWDDPGARDQALAQVLGLLDRVQAFLAGQAGEPAAATALAVARQVRDQDVDLSGPAPALLRGVAKDRRISVEDGQCGTAASPLGAVRRVQTARAARPGHWALCHRRAQ